MVFAIADVFTELLFGSGAWIGLILLVLLCIAGTMAFKYSGIIFGIIMLFLGLEYLENVSANSDFIISVVLSWITAIFLFFLAVRDIKQ